MLDSEALRRLGEAGGPFAVDLDGEAIPLDDLEDPVAPGLVVGPVTEAVKEVVEGRLVKYLNRDTLWAVEGFVLTAELVDGLSGEANSPESIIAEVEQAGSAWAPVHRAPTAPE